jgi:hypothetical protein
VKTLFICGNKRAPADFLCGKELLYSFLSGITGLIYQLLWVRKFLPARKCLSHGEHCGRILRAGLLSLVSRKIYAPGKILFAGMVSGNSVGIYAFLFIPLFDFTLFGSIYVALQILIFAVSSLPS